MKLLRRVWFGAVLAVLFAATLAAAEDDPPGRVARLQYMTGSVSVQPRGAEDWVAANLNRPLTTSDNLWTDKDSRAELNVGTGVLRLDGETSVSLTNVSDNTVQVQLHQGVLNLRVRKLYRGEIYEVDTPNIAFTVQKSGRYRFDVGPSGEVTLVTVWKGEGDATGDGPAVRVRSHERARFTNGTSLAHEIYRAPQYDGFDDWCLVRDRRQDGAVSAQYVAPGVIGYEDLDDYGAWQTVPAYGPVWVPAHVSYGWAPYRYGHWAWISPWGWTWVDDAAWGFAPYHYGRWVYVGYWAWVPGPVYVRPVYAPALVAWFGGDHFAVGLSFGGGYGWCPLGYGEPYIPWYRGSRRYFQNVNVTNTRITNITYVTNNYYNDVDHHRHPGRPWQYANVKAPGAVTAVPRDVVEHSRPVAQARIPVSHRDVKDWGRASLAGDVQVAPAREARLGYNSPQPAPRPADHIVTRPVVAKIAPPVAPARERFSNGPLDNRVDRPQPTRVAENEPLTSPVRRVPRPPQASDNLRTPSPAPRVAQPPASSASEARVVQPSVGRNVPKPPTPHTPEAAPQHRDTLPAVRQVPQPPSTTATGDRPARPNVPDNNVRDHNVPRPPTPPKGIGPDEHVSRGPATEGVSQPPAESRNHNVPRPSGPVAGPKSTGPDEHIYRGPASDGSSAQPGSHDVPRPSAPIAAPRSSGSDVYRGPSSPAPIMRSEPAAPRSESPRSEAPRMSAPAPSHSAPAPSAPRSAPAPGPAPHNSGPSGDGGHPHSR
ncbi:MAG TPA: DUF6600 domain-containing protein [Terriglobales bacterium]|nr:DUF6600 domain-containing protein [Terriglobales bacterium]